MVFQRNGVKGLLGTIFLSFCLLLCGCMASVPSYVEEPESIGQLVILLLRVAFIRPWLLLPSLWNGITQSWSDWTMDPFSLGILIGLIGGIHIGLGALIFTIGGEIHDSLASIGTIWALYGGFIWVSCFVVWILASLL